MDPCVDAGFAASMAAPEEGLPGLHNGVAVVLPEWEWYNPRTKQPERNGY
jgi:hypothetical protein